MFLPHRGGGKKLITGLLASLIIISISKQSEKIIPFDVVRKNVEWLGRNTLEIYVLHYYIIQVCRLQINFDIIKPILLFVFVFFLSSIAANVTSQIAQILSLIPYIRLCAFGKK